MTCREFSMGYYVRITEYPLPCRKYQNECNCADSIGRIVNIEKYEKITVIGHAIHDFSQKCYFHPRELEKSSREDWVAWKNYKTLSGQP